MLPSIDQRRLRKKEMKVVFRICIYFLLSCWVTAAEPDPLEGQLIELSTWFNGRKQGSNSFVDYKSKDSKNIAATFPPGTKGSIAQVKNFASGNFGLKVRLTNIPKNPTVAAGVGLQTHLGKEVWFFYNPKKKNLTLLDSQEAKTDQPDKAKKAITTTTQPGLVTSNTDNQPANGQAKTEAANTTNTAGQKVQSNLQTMQEAPLQNVGSSDCKTCSVANAGLGSISACELQIGSSKFIDRKITPEESVRQKYRLSRQSLTKFTVELNLNFIQGSGFSNAASSIELNSSYKRKANKCLEQVNSTLKGPNNKSFEIKLSDDVTIPSYNVTVDTFQISESTSWDRNINCPDIIHEMMHLIGLVDEYPETRLGITRNQSTGQTSYSTSSSSKAYNCRHLGNPKSIMFNPTAAIEEALGVTEYRRISCFCSSSSTSCEQINQKHRDAERCPDGQIKKEITENGVGNASPQSNPSLEPGEVILGYSKIKRQVKVLRESLLFPAQFRLITSPDCNHENALYLECAKNAYRTTAENDGKGCDLSVPPACKQGGTPWLN